MDELGLLAAGPIGGVDGPGLLEEYRTWRRNRSCKASRHELLKKMLSGDLVYRTLDTLTGTTAEDCRSLLIEIGGAVAPCPTAAKPGR